MGLVLGWVIFSYSFDTNKLPNTMLGIARDSFIVGCVMKPTDCKKGGENFENTIRDRISHF